MNGSNVVRIAEQLSPCGGVAKVLFDLVASRICMGENADATSAVLPFFSQSRQFCYEECSLAATRTSSHINRVHALENLLARISPACSVKCINRQTQQLRSPTNVIIRDRGQLKCAFTIHSQAPESGTASTVLVT